MKSRRVKFIVCIIAVVLILFIAGDIIASKHFLSLSEYSLESDRLNSTIRIIQLTDLHNSVFGQSNQRLINRIAEQNPNLILITGDLLNSSEDNTEIATDLIKNLSAIADVYVSMGNHEIEFRERTGADIKKMYVESGAYVLDESYTDISINGQKLRIGGVYGYCLPERYHLVDERKKSQCELLKGFQNTDRYKILMSHLPYAWWNYGFGNDWDVDLVLCGDTHGGQVIIPFLGGLYDGETGWFPGYISGYKHNGCDIIVSRGLGNTESLPRLNNIPEIVVIDID